MGVKGELPVSGHAPGTMNEEPVLKPGETQVVSLPEETRFTPNGIVSRTLFRVDRQRVVLFGFAAGQELSEHTSTSHALVQILSGKSEWTLAGTPRTLVAGDLLHMPPHLPHAVRAEEPFSMLLILLPEAPTSATTTSLPRIPGSRGA